MVACSALVDVDALAVVASVAVVAGGEAIANNWRFGGGCPRRRRGRVRSVGRAGIVSGAGTFRRAGILAIRAAADAVEAAAGVVLAAELVAAVVAGAGHERRWAGAAIGECTVFVRAVVAVVEAVAELVLEDGADDVHVVSVDAL